MSSTAGKGPGIVIRAENRSGVIRLSSKVKLQKAMLEVLDQTGAHAELGLTADECRKIGAAFLKVATAISTDDVTQQSPTGRRGPLTR